MPTVNDLSIAPQFAPHRTGLSAADGSNSDKKAEGVNCEGFNDIAVDVVKVSGTITDLDVEVLFWSETTGAFVSQDAQITKADHTTGFQFVFESQGRIFWVKITTLTGTTPVVSIYVAGRPDR